MSIRPQLSEAEYTLVQKVLSINWFLVFVICGITALGIAALYSLADGATDTWVGRQLVRFIIGLTLMFIIALTHIRIWLSLAYIGYVGSLALLLAVEMVGVTGMGATRWMDIGIVTLQPSELMKLALILSLARYYHELTLEQTRNLTHLFIPVFLIAAPAILVLRQPDLGTASLLVLSGVSILLLAGIRMSVFITSGIAAIAAIPVGWPLLRDYQQARILTFLDPERDPLGAGYHIIQSKIALGAGGLFGRGYREGTQSHLQFLPEMQTDFIFTTLAEEMGFLGALILIGLYAVVLIYGLSISLLSRNQFGRLVAMGVSTTFFYYVFINIAMVTGLVPVVGVPLPLISYGGTAMVTLLAGFGFLICVYIHRDVRIPRHSRGSPIS